MGRRRSFGLVFLCLLGLFGFAFGKLKMGFYKESCPDAEEIVLKYVKMHIPHEPGLAASLLRMHFHDCFVRGCDASLLLNSTSEKLAEKDAPPNLSVKGFAFIDAVKSLLEAKCPGIVSCADIIALATRDSIITTGGPFWNVPTGRRDGTKSNATEAKNLMPSSSSDFTMLKNNFTRLGLNVKDLVLLSGAHTIGVSSCGTAKKRLYLEGGGEDPSLDSEYAANLKSKKCKTKMDNTTVLQMDPGSHRTFDLSYYKLLLKRRGLFKSDAALTTNSVSLSIIKKLVHGTLDNFFAEFAESVEKMGAIRVKTGTTGEIRKHCALVN